MLGKSLLDFVPLRVVRWIVRRVGEIRGGGVAVVRLRFVREGGPVASDLDIFPADAVEERKRCEGAEHAEEVKNEFPVSPWDACPDGVWRNCGEDGGTHVCRHSNRLALAPNLARLQNRLHVSTFASNAHPLPPGLGIQSSTSGRMYSREFGRITPSVLSAR